LKKSLKNGIIIVMSGCKKIFISLIINYSLLINPIPTYALMIDNEPLSLSPSSTEEGSDSEPVSLPPISSSDTSSSSSINDELWSEKIEDLLDFVRSHTSSGIPGVFTNTTQPAPPSTQPETEPTTSSLVTISSPGPDSSSTTLPISIQETDTHYVIHLPLYVDIESGESIPVEIQVSKDGIQKENGRLTISELKIEGASFQNLVIDTENNSLVSGEIVFDDGTRIRIEEGAITEYTSPKVEEIKELLSNVTDSDGQPYYTLHPDEDPTALTDRLREAYLRFQYDLLMGNISSDNLPQDDISCIVSDGQNSITIPPALLAQLEENNLIEYTQDGKYQLSVSLNGLEIPFPVKFNFKNEYDFSRLKDALEKGIIDENGNINLRIYTPEDTYYDLKVPFAFFCSDSLRDLSLNPLISDVYLFVNDYINGRSSQGAHFIEYIPDQNLFEIRGFIDDNDIDALKEYFGRFQPVSTALIPGINSSGILEQLQTMQARNFQNSSLNQIYHQLFQTAHSEIEPLLQQLHQAIQSGDTETGYSILGKINEILETTMNRVQLASICVGYIQRIEAAKELASQARTLAAPDDLNLYEMELRDILNLMQEGNWDEAYENFAEVISYRGWDLQADGTIPELERILSQIKGIAGRELAIQRATEFIAMSLLSIIGGQLIGGAVRALIARGGWLGRLVSTIGATRAGRIGGALLKTIIQGGNYLDELSEAGISSGARLVDLLLACGGRPGALIAQKLSSTLTGYALRMGLNAALVGTATYYTTVDENNRFWQFINNPIGFLFPSTESLGNLGDICEFIDLAIRAYNGQPISTPGLEVTTYRSENPASVRKVFAQAVQSLATFNDWLTEHGFVPGLTIKIVSEEATEHFSTKIESFGLPEGTQKTLISIFNQFYHKFGNTLELKEIENLIINYTEYLLNTGQNILQAKFTSLLQNLDSETIKIYNSIIEKANTVFASEQTGNYSETFRNIRKHILKLASTILKVYSGETGWNVEKYPDLDDLLESNRKTIAERALQDLNFILSYLETGETEGLEIKVEEVKDEKDGSILKRLNFYVDDFDSQRYSTDEVEKIWKYFEVNALLSDRVSEKMFRRLSFRFDLVGEDMQLDITSPYLYMALAFAGDHGLYHGTIAPGIGIEGFEEFIAYIQSVINGHHTAFLIPIDKEELGEWLFGGERFYSLFPDQAPLTSHHTLLV